MKKTANVQLNQWDEEDRILRTDFNADNEKLDAAIGAIAAETRVVKLLDATAEQEAKQIDLDVSGIDLTAYHELWLYIHYDCAMEAGSVRLRVNGLSDGYANGDNTAFSHCISTSLDERLGQKKITLNLGARVGVSNVAPVGPGEVETINLVGVNRSSATTSGSFAVGTNFQIYGVKQ